MSQGQGEVIRWVTIRGRRVPITHTPPTARGKERLPESEAKLLADVASAIFEALSDAARDAWERGRDRLLRPSVHISEVVGILRRKWRLSEENVIHLLAGALETLLPYFRDLLEWGPSREPPNVQVGRHRIGRVTVGRITYRRPARELWTAFSEQAREVSRADHH